MPTQLTTSRMTSGITVEEYIRTQPDGNRPFLISAACECLRRNYPLNSCELYSMARELRYATEDKYSFGNDVLSVTDVGAKGDNVLLGDDGQLYFIDPIIRLKRSALEVVEWLVGDCEIVSRLFKMYAKLTAS